MGPKKKKTPKKKAPKKKKKKAPPFRAAKKPRAPAPAPAPAEKIFNPFTQKHFDDSMKNLRGLGGKSEPLPLPKPRRHRSHLSKAARKKIAKIANDVHIKKQKKKKIHYGKGFWKDTEHIEKQKQLAAAAAAAAQTETVAEQTSTPVGVAHKKVSQKAD